MSASDYLISLIRTAVPVAVGALLSWLAVRAGIVVNEDTRAGLVIGFTGLAVAIYYAIVRLLEARWPWIGRLLIGGGVKAQPTYPAKTLDGTFVERTGPIR